MKSKTFEEKLVEILALTLSGKATPVEYSYSNESSKTKGKFNRVVTFKYELNNPTEEIGPKNK